MMSNWTVQRAIFGCSVRSAPCSVLGNVERGTLEKTVKIREEFKNCSGAGPPHRDQRS